MLTFEKRTMNAMSIGDNLKRGTIELMLLTLLKEGDKYGYELSQTLEERSDGLFTIKESTMYPTLYRLQSKGLITDRQEKVGVRRTRVYYHLEAKGEEYLQEIQKEYVSLNRGIFKILGYSGLEDAEG